VYFFGNFERCGQSAAKLLSKDEGSRIADQSHKVLCGDQILRLGLTLLNHQIRIAATLSKSEEIICYYQRPTPFFSPSL
jgi:hypothetical protein